MDIERKIKEVIRRVERLENGQIPTKERTRDKDDGQGEEVPWSTVIGRKKKKKRDHSLVKPGGGFNQEERVIEVDIRREKENGKEKEKGEEIRRKKTRLLQALRRKLPQGGRPLGPPGGRSGSLRGCNKEMSKGNIPRIYACPSYRHKKSKGRRYPPRGEERRE